MHIYPYSQSDIVALYTNLHQIKLRIFIFKYSDTGIDYAKHIKITLYCYNLFPNIEKRYNLVYILNLGHSIYFHF